MGQAGCEGLYCLEYGPSPVVLSPVTKPKYVATTPVGPLESWTGMHVPSQVFVDLEPALIDA